MATSEDSNDYVKYLLNEGSKVPIDTIFKDDDLELPPWFNEEKFKKGQDIYKRNIFAMFVGMLCGLIAVLSIPTILNVLICTKKSSKPVTAYRRYIKTIFHVVLWHKDDLKPGSKMWKSLLLVRRLHIYSSTKCQEANKNIVITQKDMALTQFGFMGFTTLDPKKLGITPDEDHYEATIHFWRVIGYMLGIKDDFNLCTDNWSTTKQRLQVVLNDVYKPSLLTREQNFMSMVEALLSGLWSFNPFLAVDIYLYFTRRLAHCEGYEYFKDDYDNKQISNDDPKLLYKELSLYMRFRLFLTIYLHQYLYRYFIFRVYFNFQIVLSLFLIYYFPFLAFPRFGFKQSYVRIFKTK